MVGDRGGKGSGLPPTREPDPAEIQLEFLRATSEVYKALVRNVSRSYTGRGYIVDDRPPPREKVAPTLIAVKEQEQIIFEFATAPMLANDHLVIRLRALAEAPLAKLHLVVSLDLLAEARELVDRHHLPWRVVPGEA